MIDVDGGDMIPILVNYIEGAMEGCGGIASSVMSSSRSVISRISPKYPD